MEISKIFFDINIVLDIIEKDRLNHENSIKVWESLVLDEVEIFISEDMLSTIYYISKDKRYVLDFFNLIYKRWNIVPFGKEVIKKSIDFSIKNKTDLEDTLQCFCAKENNCNIFLTSDKKFIDCGIKIQNYKEFLS